MHDKVQSVFQNYFDKDVQWTLIVVLLKGCLLEQCIMITVKLANSQTVKLFAARYCGF